MYHLHLQPSNHTYLHNELTPEELEENANRHGVNHGNQCNYEYTKRTRKMPWEPRKSGFSTQNTPTRCRRTASWAANQRFRSCYYGLKFPKGCGESRRNQGTLRDVLAGQLARQGSPKQQGCLKNPKTPDVFAQANEREKCPKICAVAPR